MKKSAFLAAACAVLLLNVAAFAAGRADAFDKAKLYQAPKEHPLAKFGGNGVKASMLEGVDCAGKPTRFFVYYGLPKGASESKKVPGIVLVHGGGGTAFDFWVRTWTARGYAAIAMDNCGGVPPREREIGRLSHRFSGPDGWGNFEAAEKPERDQWPYQAISCVILSHSFLRSLPEVDASRIGITGISWGGYLTACTAGIDDRFLFAVPVYGCAYLYDHSVWSDSMHRLGATGRKWHDLWDAANYLPNAKMPMLWCAGSNDHFFPLDSWQRGYRLPAVKPQLACKVRMVHSHPPQGDPPEITAFADHFAFGKPALPAFAENKLEGSKLSVRWNAFGRRVAKAELVYTKGRESIWEKRYYETVAVPVKGDAAVATVPGDATVFWMNVMTDDGLVSSSEHFERKDR